jgi:hypothetical protein
VAGDWRQGRAKKQGYRILEAGNRKGKKDVRRETGE